jgi:hypothetical protein
MLGAGSLQAASVSYDLTQTNDTTGNISNGTPYVRVTIDDIGGKINFNVTILNSILTANAGTNFGLQIFGFNASDSLGLTAGNITGQPTGWLATVECSSPSPMPSGLNLDGLGLFDAKVSDGGSSRVDPTLSFSIDTGNIADYELLSSNGSMFAARIAGFEDLNPLPPADDPYDGTGSCYDTTGQGDFTPECNILTSVWVGGGTVVPVPAAVWLFGSGLLGLIGVARRKRA